MMTEIPRTVFADVKSTMMKVVVDNDLERAAEFLRYWCPALPLPRSFPLRRPSKIPAPEFDGMKVLSLLP